MQGVLGVASKVPGGSKLGAAGFRMIVKMKLNSFGVPEFGVYMKWLGIVVGIVASVCGGLSFIPKFGKGRWYFGVYAIVVGIIIAIWDSPLPKYLEFLEEYWKNLLYRGIAYPIAGLPCFGAPIGAFAGIVIIGHGLAHAVCWARMDSLEKPESPFGYSPLGEGLMSAAGNII
jgi:hypothetical protein